MRRQITITSPAEKTTREGLDDFIAYQKALNNSPKSIGYYINCYEYFIKYFGEGNLCNQINERVIIEYINFLYEKDPPLSGETVKSYLIGLRAIIYYWQKEGYIQSFTIIVPKTDTTIKEPYSDEDIKRLIKEPQFTKCGFAEVRDWAMVCFFLATGCRLSTAINVQIGDVSFTEKEIFVRKTKNRKQQIIPMSLELEKTLRTYLRYRKGENEDYLFCNVYGECLSKNSVTSTMRRYIKKRGVTKTGIHRFRHTFAKNWIINGGDMFRLQKILGHSTLDMVKQYVAIFGGDLKRDYERFSVLDRVKENETVKHRITMK